MDNQQEQQEAIPHEQLEKIEKCVDEYVKDVPFNRGFTPETLVAVAYRQGVKDGYRMSRLQSHSADDWNEVRPDNLPEIDEFILWRTESGNYFFREIDKDDYAWWNGEGPTGMHGIICTHWKRIVGPGESTDKTA